MNGGASIHIKFRASGRQGVSEDLLMKDPRRRISLRTILLPPARGARLGVTAAIGRTLSQEQPQPRFVSLAEKCKLASRRFRAGCLVKTVRLAVCRRR